MQTAKTQLWHHPAQRGVAWAIAEELQCEVVSRGMTICGYSLCTSEEEELPLGGGTFIEDFLAVRLAAIDKELQELRELDDELGEECGLQITLALLRVFLPGKVMHLLRGCPWAFYPELGGRLGERGVCASGHLVEAPCT